MELEQRRTDIKVKENLKSKGLAVEMKRAGELPPTGLHFLSASRVFFLPAKHVLPPKSRSLQLKRDHRFS